MSEEQFNPNRRKISSSGEAFTVFLESNGKMDYFNQRILDTWRKYGKEAAKRFCINDADKFDDEEIKLFVERELFDAGEDGLSKKTPWNTYRRNKAGLPHLHSYDEPTG
jgi:hypothetical protein